MQVLITTEMEKTFVSRETMERMYINLNFQDKKFLQEFYYLLWSILSIIIQNRSFALL